MARVHERRRFIKGLFTALRIVGSYRVAGFLGIFLGSEWRAERFRTLHTRNAVLIRETALEMKGVMIKLGQFLSSRIDLLPDEYIRELSLLQDQVPPHEYAGIRRRIAESLGASPEEIFPEFDERPIAAASLGQVHRAKLRDGREVAVKVQYPGIEAIIETDIAMFRVLIRILGKRYGTIDLLRLHAEFSGIVRAELDYVREGKNAERFRANFGSDARVIFPSVVWEHTRQKVLTLEFVHGIKITECGEMTRAGIDCGQVVDLLSETYAKMFFVHGFFHGDPHPGNIFVRPGPVLVFVDFGMVQKIPGNMVRNLRAFANAIVERNTAEIVDALDRMGFIIQGADYEALMDVAQSLIDKYRAITPAELKALTVEDISREIEHVLGIVQYIQIPNNYILLGRSIGMLNGIAFTLNPEVNIIELGKPYIREFVKGSAGEQADHALQLIREKLYDLWNLPSELKQFLKKANRGELSFKLARREIREITGQFKSLTDVMMLVVLTVTTAASALFFVLIHNQMLATAAAASSVIFGLLSAWRLMKS